MISRKIVYDQLHNIGFNPFSWGRTEVRELCNIMLDGETIVQCVNGEYSNGFALLAATNHRVLLVDKKPFLYLTVEDVRFEQISDFNYRNQFITANITISTANKTLHFTSYNKKRLRSLIHCIQERVIGMREEQDRSRELQTAMAAQHVYGNLGGMMAPNMPQAQLPQMSNQFAEPARAYAPNQAAVPTETYQPVMTPQPTPQPQLHHHTSFGVYTRSKLPSLHRHQSASREIETRDSSEASDQAALSGELYPQGYRPRSIADYQMPFEY